MKNKSLYRLVMFVCLLFIAKNLLCKNKGEIRIRFETSMGGFTVALFDDTPSHRDNFVRLVKQGYYNGTIFHRVIADFMIQGGDPNTKIASANPATFGEGGPGYTIRPEIMDTTNTGSVLCPLHYHLNGALAMARESDKVNPERRSSGSQFYIVCGVPMDSVTLRKRWVKLQQQLGDSLKLPNAIKRKYMKEGGSPHLDGQYTIFGRVISGMNVVRAINAVETDPTTDRPLENVIIIRAFIKK